jgi:diacylglycerol kinase family enzyme
MVDQIHIVKRKEFSSVAVAIMDTTYFGRGFGVMVFKNSLDGVVLYKQYGDNKNNSPNAEVLSKFLLFLLIEKVLFLVI